MQTITGYLNDDDIYGFRLMAEFLKILAEDYSSYLSPTQLSFEKDKVIKEQYSNTILMAFTQKVV